MTSITLISKRIGKNYQENKWFIILLLAILVLLILYNLMKNNKEGFAPTTAPTPKPTLSPLLKSNYYFTTNFSRQNFNKTCEYKMEDGRYISFWIRSPENNYFPVGQVAIVSSNIADKNIFKADDNEGLSFLMKGGAKPSDYEKIWDNSSTNSTTPLSVWKVIPPTGHLAMSDITVSGYEKPSLDLIRCIPNELLKPVNLIGTALWKTPQPISKTTSGIEISPPGALSIWSIGNYGFFFAKDSYLTPDNRKEKICDINKLILENEELDVLDKANKISVTLKI
jgi:hypothetical protein